MEMGCTLYSYKLYSDRHPRDNIWSIRAITRAPHQHNSNDVIGEVDSIRVSQYGSVKHHYSLDALKKLRRGVEACMAFQGSRRAMRLPKLSPDTLLPWRLVDAKCVSVLCVQYSVQSPSPLVPPEPYEKLSAAAAVVAGQGENVKYGICADRTWGCWSCPIQK